MKKNVFVIVHVIIIVLFTTINVAAYDNRNTSSDMIKVGLMYGETSTSLVKLYSGSGFDFGYYHNGEFYQLLNLMDNEDIVVRKNGYFMELNNSYIETYPNEALSRHNNVQGPYHVEVGEVFQTKEEVIDYIDFLNDETDKQFYLAYRNGWRIWGGLFANEEGALDFIASYQDIINNSIKVIEPNNMLVQVLDKNGHVILVFDSQEKDYYFRSFLEKDSNNVINVNGKSFRGEIQFKIHGDNNLTVINYLSVQEYLYGVLPREMSGDWPLEALKAQAVAARNFALANRGKHGAYGFDVCTTTDCQVYSGLDVEKPRSNRAVDETEGKILTHNGRIISAFFHSNSGGHTEDSENIWSISLPYIRGVGDEFSLGAPNSNWTKVYSPNEVTSILSNNGYDIGNVIDMHPESFSENGRVLSLAIKGSRDEIVLEKEKTRAIFGYNNIKSMWFNINGDANSIAEKEIYIKSSEFNKIIKKSPGEVYVLSGNNVAQLPQSKSYSIYNGSQYASTSNHSNSDNFNSTNNTEGFVFNGRGWGHGLGMSQWGAKKMAEMGYNYEEILKHYYVETILE